MNPETSPFRPGRPAPIELFVGRSTEIERLHGLVRRSAQGTLGVGFVTGERGIGKSSLAALVRHRAEHDSNAVGCHVYLGGVDDVPEMLRRTFHRLLNESIDKPWHQQLTSFLGNRIKSAERRRELLAGQPSLDRVFEVVDISPWSDEEVSEFYQQTFQRGGATVSEQDLERMVQFTGGLPVLAHEIGDAVWRSARTRDIKTAEVANGIITAAEVIGSKLLEPGVFHAIRSQRYRSILRQIALRGIGDRPRMHFRRSEVLERLGGKDKPALDNFLRRMKKLGAIESDPEIHGGYRFPNRLHALYFAMESHRHSRGSRRS